MPYVHRHVTRTVACPGCGHLQEVVFNLHEVQVVERCEACGKVARFERARPGLEAWRENQR